MKALIMDVLFTCIFTFT